MVFGSCLRVCTGNGVLNTLDLDLNLEDLQQNRSFLLTFSF